LINIRKAFSILRRPGVIITILVALAALIILNFVEWGYDTPVMDGGKVISIPEFEHAEKDK
jgi:hypothetical protein